MRELSHREGGLDENVFRCTCGEWLYRGQVCHLTEITERGERNAGRLSTY